MDVRQMWDDYKSAPVANAAPQDLASNKAFGILSYIGILFVLPLIFCKDSPYGKFHANQGLILFLASLIAGLAVGAVSAVLWWVPFIGWIVGPLLSSVLGLANVGLMVVGILNAAAGEFRRLPFIGGFDLIK